MRLNLSEACHLNPLLWETAERRLSKNILRSTWAYPIFLTILTVGTNLPNNLPALLAGMWLITATITLYRFCCKEPGEKSHEELLRLTRKLRFSSILAAAQWGGFLLAVLLFSGNYSWEFLITQLCVTGAAAAILCSYAIDWPLLATLEVLMIGPGMVAHLFTGDQGWVLALLYASYLAYLLQQGHGQCTSYWHGLETDHQLKIHMEELEESQKVALEANRLKSNFMANMSHELRTPLNVIIGYSEILEEELRDRGQHDLLVDLGRIRFSGKLQLELVNQVLDLAKIEAGRADVNLEPHSLRDLVEQIEGTANLLAKKNGNRFVVEAPEAPMILTTDVVKLRQLLLNLVNNAHKFTSQGEVRMKVTIDQVEAQSWFSCTISDNGIGMNKEQLDRIFQPFVQADASTTRKYGGSGLGLMISREFARIMGGDVSVESELGKGSSFTVRIPVAVELTQQSTPGQTRSSSVAGPVHVLVIDDHSATQDLMQRYLQREGFTVSAAYDGARGMELAMREKPQAIILDVQLPGINGWEILRLLQSNPELASIPVILFTIADDRARAFLLGAAHFVQKPCDFGQIGKILNEYRKNDTSAPILVVEDNQETRELLCRRLEAQSWKTIEACDGAEALRLLDNNCCPGAILLDLMMPNINGFEFLAELRQRPQHQAVPVIVLTAMDLTAQDLAALHQQTSQQVFQKGSYSHEELVHVLAQSLRSQRG